jgi:hypothetical protein
MTLVSRLHTYVVYKLVNRNRRYYNCCSSLSANAKYIMNTVSHRSMKLTRRERRRSGGKASFIITRHFDRFRTSHRDREPMTACVACLPARSHNPRGTVSDCRCRTDESACDTIRSDRCQLGERGGNNTRTRDETVCLPLVGETQQMSDGRQIPKDNNTTPKLRVVVDVRLVGGSPGMEYSVYTFRPQANPENDYIP